MEVTTNNEMIMLKNALKVARKTPTTDKVVGYVKKLAKLKPNYSIKFNRADRTWVSAAVIRLRKAGFDYAYKGQSLDAITFKFKRVK
jgi:hypothetical protein